MIKLSIIVPCFNEEKNIERFTKKLQEVMAGISDKVNYEILFVDDDSKDATVDEIKKFIKHYPQHRLIINQRNYGVYRSSFSALKFSKGDWVIPMMPVDLQDPAELIPKFVLEIQDGVDVIAGARYDRNENFFMKAVRRFYYRFVSKFAGYDIPPYVGEFQLISRKIVEQLIEIQDYYPYTRALIAKQVSIRKILPYTWEKRTIGKSKHNIVKLYDQAINGIVTTSIAPLRFMMLFGLFISMFCFAAIMLQLIAFFSFSKNSFSPGIPTLIIAIFFCFGIVFIFLGLLGEYIAAIHSQVRNNYRVQSQEYLK